MKKDKQEPEAAPEEQIEDLDVPDSEADDVKGGFGSPAATATGTGSYGSPWGTKK